MKSLLLTKSNFKKSRGLSIGISVLIFVIALLMSASLIISFDFLSDIDRQKEKLNAGDACVLVTTNIDGLDNEFFEYALINDIDDESIVNGFGILDAIKYSNGTVTAFLYATSMERLEDVKVGKTEIVEEDPSITSNYCYVQYQFHTGGGYNIGDTFELQMPGITYSYKIRGFLNNYYLGSYNTGLCLLILSEDEIMKLEANYPENNTILINYDLKDGVDEIKFINRISQEISKVNPHTYIRHSSNNEAKSNRTFVSLIFIVSFFATSIILLFVAILMISNIISNYIKQNMKSIGVLKAIGYRSSEIKGALLLQFGFLSFIGSFLGATLVYLLMPLLSRVLVAQYGMPYNVSFNFFAFIIPFLSITLLVILLVILFTRRINKIDPIVALKDGIETHNFKRNIIPLDKSKLGLNFSLALKSFFNNIKQNIITFFVLFGLTFCGVLASVMLENFGLNPNISILTFETCNGVVSSDVEVKDDLYDYLKNRSDITNVKFMVQISVIDSNDIDLTLFLTDDIDKFNNKNVIYKGRFPKYDNEIVVSGKYAKQYNLNIGDEVNISYAGSNYNYLITGLCQTTNNGGRECLLSTEAFSHITSISNFPGYYWFNTTSDTNQIFDDIKALYNEHITSTLNFDETISGSISIFVIISWAMMGIIIAMTTIVILLVLYLLMKNLIHNKKYEYGVLKSLGYQSKDLILQNAISFMPSIIVGTIISCIVSSLLANPYLTLIMSTFGIMQSNMTIPVGLIILICLFEILISFGFSIILSRKIKYLEPYKLLIAE